MQAPSREIQVECECDPIAVPVSRVQQAVRAVLDGQTSGPAQFSVTFVSAERIRDLNRQHFGRDGTTDVIAFALPHPGLLVGDLYVCPAVARATADETGISEEEELLRLVVHGTLHVLGYEHPEGDERRLSPMWRVQEGYVLNLRQQRP